MYTDKHMYICVIYEIKTYKFVSIEELASL